jgi:hypothetical protein
MDIDDDDDSVIEIAPPNANATAKNMSPGESTSIASTPNDDSDAEVVEVKPPRFKLKPPSPPTPTTTTTTTIKPDAAGRAPPASTQRVMEATKDGTKVPEVAPTSSTSEKLAILRNCVGTGFTDQQLAECVKECCYDVPWAAGVLLAERGPPQGRGGKSRSSSKVKFPLANWSNRFNFLCSKANIKYVGEAPSASSSSSSAGTSTAAAASGHLPLLAVVR